MTPKNRSSQTFMIDVSTCSKLVIYEELFAVQLDQLKPDSYDMPTIKEAACPSRQVPTAIEGFNQNGACN